MVNNRLTIGDRGRQSPKAPKKKKRSAGTRARRLSADERRALLLTAAMAVFAKRGIGEARPSEIAQEAGVSEATVFAYFRTRHQLVLAVISEVERLYLKIDRHFLEDTTLPVWDSIHSVAQTFSDSVDRYPDHARVFLDWGSTTEPEIFERYLAFQEEVIKMLTRTLRLGRRDGAVAPDINAADAARMAFASSLMIVQMKLTKRPRRQIDRYLKSLVCAVVGQHPKDRKSGTRKNLIVPKRH